MNTRFFIVSVIVLMCLASAKAKVYDTLILNDGFQLSGQILERIPGESYTIKVEKIKGSIKKTYVERVSSKDPVDGTQEIILNDDGLDAYGIEDESQPASNDYIHYSLMKKGKLLKGGAVYEFEWPFQENDNNVFTINIDDVESVVTPAKSTDSKRGLVDIIETNEDVYRGHITQNVLGKEFVIIDENGIENEISSDDVISLRTEAINENEDIFTQAELLDLVYTNECDEPYVGVIVEKSYDNENPDNDQMIIMTKDGEVGVKIDDITKFGREVNNEYRAYTISYGEVWICGKKGKKQYTKAGSVYKIPISAVRDKDKIVELNYGDLENHLLVIEHMNQDEFKTPHLIKMDEQYKLKSHERNDSKKGNYYTFTSDELFRNAISDFRHTDLDQKDIKREYKIDRPATTSDRYLLFFMNDTETPIYVIKITP